MIFTYYNTFSCSQAISSSVTNLKKTAHVTAAVSPLSDAGKDALSKNKQIGYISVTLNVGQGSITEDEANAVLDAANPAKKAGLQTAIGGYAGQEISKPDTGASDKIGILAAMLILLLVFGSAVAMGLPIVTAVLGLLCGLSVVTLERTVGDWLGELLGSGLATLVLGSFLCASAWLVFERGGPAEIRTRVDRALIGIKNGNHLPAHLHGHGEQLASGWQLRERRCRERGRAVSGDSNAAARRLGNHAGIP